MKKDFEILSHMADEDRSLCRGECQFGQLLLTSGVVDNSIDVVKGAGIARFVAKLVPVVVHGR